MQTSAFNMQEDGPQITIINVPDHDHRPDIDVIAAGTLTERMKAAIVDDPTKPVKRVYDEIAIAYSGDDEHVPEFRTVRSQLNRQRASLCPPIPRSVDQVRVEDSWARTWDGADFLSHQDNDWGILIFSTGRNYSKLRRCTDIYMDGTFKSCPKPCMQFFTIHGNYHGRVVPLVMRLMTGKTVGQYREVLAHVKEKVRRLTRHRWSPRCIVTDFESSLLLAIETELPDSQSSACYFHFCQSLWRRVQHLGLKTPYQRSRGLKKCIRKFMAIGYLPIPLVRMNFRLLVNDRQTVRLRRRFPALTEFIQYMENNYIGEGAQFRTQLWNVFDRTSDNRTNNFVEGELGFKQQVF